MASWKGEIGISVLGFAGLSLGSYELHKLGEVELKTVNVCPKCLVVPNEINREIDRYECPKCGTKYKNWYALQRAIPNGDTPIPVPKRQTEKTSKISLKLLDLSEVSGLLTKAEYAIIPRDEAAKRNIQKVGQMLHVFNKVAIFSLVFRKEGDRHICYITVNDDGLIMVREIIPLNLVKPLPAGVVQADNTIPQKEIEELMTAMPKATEDDLNVVDEVIEALPKTADLEALKKKLKKVLTQEAQAS